MEPKPTGVIKRVSVIGSIKDVKPVKLSEEEVFKSKNW